MKKLILILALTLSQTAVAGEIIIASDRGFVPVVVKIDRKADHVAVPLTIRADIDEPDNRLDAINTAMETIRAAFSTDPELRIEIGVVSLSPSEPRSKFLSSSSYASGRSSVQLYALGALTEQSDLFSRAKSINRGLGKLDLPRDVSVNVGNTALGISDPEGYRAKLLEMIREQIRSTKEALGASGKVIIRGLAGPVLVNQKSDTDVSLYIDYSIEVAM